MTDALRTPTHRLLAGGDPARALGDLVFVDRAAARTPYRTCVHRVGEQPVRTCFRAVSGASGVANVTPLRFPRGRYSVTWTVDGAAVAHWRFTVG